MGRCRWSHDVSGEGGISTTFETTQSPVARSQSAWGLWLERYEEGRDAKEDPALNSRENREPVKDCEERNLGRRWAFVTSEKKKH